MRLLLITLLILHNLPLKNANSIYEFSLPEMEIEKDQVMKIWLEKGHPDPNRTDVRFLFYSTKFGFKNPNFIRNVSEFLMDNDFNTFNLFPEATDKILETSENFPELSEKPTLWIIDFQSKDYAKIFPQFELRQLSCDEFEFLEKFRKYRNFQKFDLLLLETHTKCGSKFLGNIWEKKLKLISILMVWNWRFHDIVLLETDETTDYTYYPNPEYQEEFLSLENIKRQRYFQNIYIDALHETARICSNWLFFLEILVLLWIALKWRVWENVERYNIYYSLRRIFCIFITKSKPMENGHLYLLFAHFLHIVTFMNYQPNWIFFFRQVMNLEMVYKLARYFVNDSREVNWPLIMNSEIFDMYRVLLFRTTEYLPFELQMLKILQTLEHFVLLNQYPDLNLLIWLLGIFSLQLLSFFLYFLYPPLTWTVPILDIAPTRVRKNRYMIYSRHVAVAFVLLVFKLYLSLLRGEI
ncbi:hypothetical protein B9Z55_021452 [Caenorhabditis nigoni]|uniref:Uncharacterized protein n=1 Tax=Caenorhabditis nigoni TaxID=1611254 RepID=A0A2G5TS49_9PELO|nr:hypothetical protein B9Z55_021452 [Caenorhabditis nigoni]